MLVDLASSFSCGLLECLRVAKSRSLRSTEVRSINAVVSHSAQLLSTGYRLFLASTSWCCGLRRRAGHRGCAARAIQSRRPQLRGSQCRFWRSLQEVLFLRLLSGSSRGQRGFEQNLRRLKIVTTGKCARSTFKGAWDHLTLFSSSISCASYFCCCS
jgi:hypothetical protein